MEARGIVHKVMPTREVSATFRNRELVILYGENPQYPNYVTFAFSQDRVSMLDALQPGMEVEVSFDLSGRQWVNPQGEEKYFNELRAFNVKQVMLGTPQPATAPARSAAQAQPKAAAPVAAQEPEGGDDLPF